MCLSSLALNKTTDYNSIVISNGDANTYEQLKKEYLTTTSVDGKEICLQALGRVQISELARDYFDFLLKSGHVAVQDVHSGIASLAANGKTRYTLLECIKSDWQLVYDKLSANMVVLDRFLRLALNKFADRRVAEAIDAFFAEKDNRGYDRSLGVVKDTILANANYYEREERLLLEWLDAKGYR